jgi:hypothetical protein
LPGAAVSLAVFGVVPLLEWLRPGASLYLASWVVVVTTFVLLDVQTVDVFQEWPDVARRVRTRMRVHRLPVRVNISRN